MAIVFNAAKGRIAHLCTLPNPRDSVFALLLSQAQSEEGLAQHSTLAQVMINTLNVEAGFIGYARRNLTGLTVTIDETTDHVAIDCDDLTWTPATSNPLAKILFCYDPDTAVTGDDTVIPLFADDFTVSTSTTEPIWYVVADGGFCVNT